MCIKIIKIILAVHEWHGGAEGRDLESSRRSKRDGNKSQSLEQRPSRWGRILKQRGQQDRRFHDRC